LSSNVVPVLLLHPGTGRRGGYAALAYGKAALG